MKKKKLETQYNSLDPVDLLNNLVKLQDNFWRHAWKPSGGVDVIECSIAETVINELINSKINDYQGVGVGNDVSNFEAQNMTAQSTDNINTDLADSTKQATQQPIAEETTPSPSNVRRYRRTKKQRKDLAPRTWLTREDAFVNEWEKIKVRLELNPAISAKLILENLVEKKPDEFKISQLRTLQRRVSKWQLEQLKIHQEMQSKKRHLQDDSSESYISLIAQAVFESCETIVELVN